MVLEAKVHSANIQDRDGVKLLLEPVRSILPERLSHVWMDAGYTGEDKGASWVQRTLGWTAEIVRHPPKMAPEKVMRAWVREWNIEGVARGSRHRPEEAVGADRPEALFAEEMDSRAHFRLVGPEQEDEQRLRAAAGEWRSLHLRCYESLDGQEIGSLMRLFRQFHNGVLRSSRLQGSRKFGSLP